MRIFLRKTFNQKLTYRQDGEKESNYMKKVIRGRLYDTGKAVEIGSTYGGSEIRSDFEFWEETLFRKKTGEFFLYCIGNAMSRYAVWHGNTAGSGEQIKPLTYSEAQEWAENALDGEKYIQVFGEPEENGDRTSVTLTMTIGAFNLLRKASEKQGKSASEIVEALIRQNLK